MFLGVLHIDVYRYICYTIITAREKPPSEYTGQEVERMEQVHMTQAELIIFLETLAENVEFKAETGKEAAEIIREKIKQLK